MNLPDRLTLLGTTLGVACAAAVGLIGPGAWEAYASDISTPAFDTAQIVKFEGRDYQIENADWVSTDPTSSVEIKKIEAGRVSFVTVTTTATGTYSTDALFSRHVQYPGVTVNDVTEGSDNRFQYWEDGKWFAFQSSMGNSFSYYGANWH